MIFGGFFAQAAAKDLVFGLPVQAAYSAAPEYERYALPTAPWRDGQLATTPFEGHILRQSWQLEAPRSSLLEVIAPLRDQLVQQGYQVVLDCDARACGGFDFRYAIDVLPEPQMHVDLNNYRYVSLQKNIGERDPAVATLLVSHSGSSAFVQLTRVAVAAAPTPMSIPARAEPSGQIGAEDAAAAAAQSLVPALALPLPSGAEARGSGGKLALPPVAEMQWLLDAGLPLALEDLDFASGASALSPGDYVSLAQLAAWLEVAADRKLYLVGHTDLSGALPNNIALSEKRAQAVRATLISRYGINGARLTAKGVGPLAPRASNGSEPGRQINRRVEAVAISGEGPF